LRGLKSQIEKVYLMFNRKQYYIDNKEKIKEYNKQYCIDNEEKIKEYRKGYRRQYHIKNREKILKRAREYYLENKEKILKRNKKYRGKNPETIKEIKKRYRENNHNEISKRQKEINIKFRENNPNYYSQYFINKCRTNKKYNLNYKMRKAISKALKGNKAGRTWESLTGYTLADLIKRLNETMPQGFTWQNFLSGALHIDHIIPISAFNYTRPEHTDFKRCRALENLRLLPAKENLIKSNKLDRPFQPALKL